MLKATVPLRKVRVLLHDITITQLDQVLVRVSLKHSCAPKLQHLLTEGISIKLKFLQKLFPTHSQTISISTRIILPAISGLYHAARRLERMLGVGVTVCLHTEALALWCWSERPSRRSGVKLLPFGWKYSNEQTFPAQPLSRFSLFTQLR